MIHNKLSENLENLNFSLVLCQFEPILNSWISVSGKWMVKSSKLCFKIVYFMVWMLKKNKCQTNIICFCSFFTFLDPFPTLRTRISSYSVSKVELIVEIELSVSDSNSFGQFLTVRLSVQRSISDQIGVSFDRFLFSEKSGLSQSLELLIFGGCRAPTHPRHIFPDRGHRSTLTDTTSCF